MRITRRPKGSVDGIPLDGFVVGAVYDVGTLLGCFLLAEELASPEDDGAPARANPAMPLRFRPVDRLDQQGRRKHLPGWASLRHHVDRAAEHRGGPRKRR